MLRFKKITTFFFLDHRILFNPNIYILKKLYKNIIFALHISHQKKEKFYYLTIT